MLQWQLVRHFIQINDFNSNSSTVHYEVKENKEMTNFNCTPALESLLGNQSAWNPEASSSCKA